MCTENHKDNSLIRLIRIETAFNDCLSVSLIPSFVTFDQFITQIRGFVDIDENKPMTVKWIDPEGDPIILSSQIEFLEMIRLALGSPDPRIRVHIFLAVPEKPGVLCPNETWNMYRRGIKHMLKIYQIRGHSYSNKFPKKNIPCVYCHQSVWRFFSNSLSCSKCNLFVHKRCYRAYQGTCGGVSQVSEDGSEKLNVSGDFEEESEFESDKVELKNFRFLSVIGAGSYAKVFAAEFRPTKKIYALKVILKSILFDHSEDLESVFIEKEVFRISTLNHFLVGLHSTFQTRNRLVFVIDFANGGDLMSHMEQMQRLSEDHSRFYGGEIILGLDFLHSNGIIYRDLKLDNVLLEHDGHVKLTDYGLCKINTYPGDVTSTFCGTPNYLAPELITGPNYGFQVDYWALGVLMYELMSGRSPFEVPPNIGEAFQEEYLFQMIVNKNVRIPRFLSASASSLLQELLDRDPATRLGCNLETGRTDLETHSFFRSVDWEALKTRSVVPPFKPNVSDRNDLSKIPETFTKRRLRFTKQFLDVASRVDQSVFKDFNFINEEHFE